MSLTRLSLGFALLSSFSALFAVVPPAAAQAAPADSLRDGFAHPPASAKPRCYWWWLNGNTTEETITRDLEGMKSHGFAGAILVDADGSGQEGNAEVPVGPAIGSPKWIALYVHALDVAQRLGLEISLNVTSRWDVGIIGGSTVTPEDALKKLTWSRLVVEGGTQRTIELPAPPIENGFYRPIATLAYPLHHGAPLAGTKGNDRTAISDLAAKKASVETGISMQLINKSPRNADSVAGEQDADLGEVIDLSTHLRNGRTLDWNPPSGTWEILTIGYTDTDRHLRDFHGTPLGLPLDAMSATAFDDYWGKAVQPLLDAAKPYLGKSLRYLVTDSWEAGGTNWTDGFREEFRRRRGYDPVPYLPIVAGRILSSRETSDRFLFDLRRTVADLIAENYYDRFAEHAQRYGLGTHPEAGGPHGAPIDALENFRSASFPQTEFWASSASHRTTDSDRYFIKEGASAAHIYGKPFVAAEGLTSMTTEPWSESPGRNLQPAFDQALTEGLNLLFWHEFTSSPTAYGLPGQEYFAGTHMNPNVTWWNQAPALLTAFSRAQFLLQQGVPVSDALYFYGNDVPSFVRVKSEDPAHILPGYDYDTVSEDALLHRIRYSGSDLFTPEGAHYHALVLPASRKLSPTALAWISEFVQQGGAAIGPQPLYATGIVPEDTASHFRRTVEEMWGGCKTGGTIEAHYGKGLVLCTADARQSFTSLGVGADFSWQLGGDHTASDSAASFDYIHRRTDAAEIYFVRNTTSAEVSATLSFRVKGRAPELWTPESGVTAPALVYRETSDGRTEIPLRFSAKGSVFVVFERGATPHFVSLQRNGSVIFPSIQQGAGVYAAGNSAFAAHEAGDYVATDSNGKSMTFAAHSDSSATESGPAEIGTWTLSFPSGWGTPASIPVDRFQSWTEMQDAGIRYFSGTATYHTTVRIPAQNALAQRQLWLNLGDVREVASVVVNGTPVQTLWKAPFLVRIDPFLHAGENTIEIQVTNLWPNRIIGDLQPSAAARYTHTNVRAYTKDSPLLPSGLLTPVTLQTDWVFKPKPAE